MLIQWMRFVGIRCGHSLAPTPCRPPPPPRNHSVMRDRARRRNLCKIPHMKSTDWFDEQVVRCYCLCFVVAFFLLICNIYTYIRERETFY